MMENSLKHILSIALFLVPTLLLGQLSDSSRTTISLGLCRNHLHLFSAGSISLEHVLPSTKVSIVGSLGLNPVSRKSWKLPLWRLNWQVATELRYYFALHRKRSMTGFFAGLLVAYDHVGYYYDGSTSPNLIATWFSIGPLLGYQHAFGNRFVAGCSFATGFHPAYGTRIYDDHGTITYKYVSGFGWQYYTFLRLGYRF
jgi:Protein of unknown function (DUF3575)